MARDRGIVERLTRFSIDRRVSVVVLLASVLVVGGVAFSGLPVELFPQGFDSPFMRIYVPWPDAPPREVLEKISEPLEEELSTVRGIDRMTSVSRVGSASVYMSFKQGTDMDLAYREVRDRMERARREFPDDVDRIYSFKEDISGIPVTVLGVAVDPTVGDVYNLIDKLIVRRIERVDGVASVEVNGLEEKEILIELDRERTEAAGLSIYDLAMQLGDDSFTLASGKVFEGDKKLLLRSVARYSSIDELRNRPVTNDVRLGDIATITYDEPEKLYRVRAMSQPAYAVIILKEGDANVREVSDRVAVVMEEMRNDPRLAAAQIINIFDQGDVVDESLGVLLQSGMIGGTVAAFVLFFFLRRLRVTIVVNLAIPLSLLIAVTVMFFIGETLNLLSLLALMVCVGLLVDNSVVVAENIDRLNREGATRREAALRGTGEIGLAITMSTLTTIIVFLPVSLVEGQAQFFLLRMSIPISIALLASLIVALVVVPLGVVLTLPPDRAAHNAKPRPWVAVLRKMWDWSFGLLATGYNAILARALSHRIEVVVALAIVAALTGVAWKQAGLEIVDQQKDERAGFDIDVRMPRHYTLEETEAWFLEAEKIIEDHASELGLEGWFLFHGKTFGELQGWFTTPRSTDLTPQEITERVVELVPRRAGMELITGDDNQMDDEDEDEATWAVTLHGDDPDQLDEVAAQLEEIFLNVPGVFGIRTSEDQQPNEMALVVDRERTQRYGIDPRAVAGVVGYALRGQGLPKYRDEGREIPVRVRYEEEDRDDLEALASFLLPTASGEFLPLGTVTDVRMLESPRYIVRRDKRISRSITLDLGSEDPDGTRERLAFLRGRLDLPDGVRFSEMQRSSQDEDLRAMQYALLVSILFIYLLMGLLFESFVLPLSIVFTIPLAAFGVFWAHLLKGLDLDFLGMVGLVLLVGVVVNNGIVLVDTINRLRADGAARRDAILTATERRFRPIMMTAITTIGGMVPLAINGRLESGISYTSFAWTLIGGLSTATLLTLLVIPVFYTFFDDLGRHFGRITGGVRRMPGIPSSLKPARAD
jgi:HAE1 family hydrophobic/amphiphilic exporter-1